MVLVLVLVLNRVLLLALTYFGYRFVGFVSRTSFGFDSKTRSYPDTYGSDYDSGFGSESSADRSFCFYLVLSLLMVMILNHSNQVTMNGEQ